MPIRPERLAADVDGAFVVFLIGMRINRPRKVWAWAPVAAAMPRMITELFQRPNLGTLHARTHFGFPDIMVVQYWRSFEQLEAYAKSVQNAHLPAWRDFNRKIGSNGDVGIWHETYLVDAGRYETVYNNMPPFGLGLAGRLVDAREHRATARGRLSGG